MKRALAGVLAVVFVGLMAAGASAQAPFFQMYFDDGSNGSYGETQINCGLVGQFQSIYVVAQNTGAFVQALDYSVAIPTGLLFLSETFAADPLVLGATPSTISPEGVAVAYGLPRNGFEPMLIATISALWTGECNCSNSSPLIVGAWPGKTSPQVIRWPDNAEINPIGMTSLLCPGPVSTTETTWGGVKALYR
jgi:hypothetical protein